MRFLFRFQRHTNTYLSFLVLFFVHKLFQIQVAITSFFQIQFFSSSTKWNRKYIRIYYSLYDVCITSSKRVHKERG